MDFLSLSSQRQRQRQRSWYYYENLSGGGEMRGFWNYAAEGFLLILTTHTQYSYLFSLLISSIHWKRFLGSSANANRSSSLAFLLVLNQANTFSYLDTKLITALTWDAHITLKILPYFCPHSLNQEMFQDYDPSPVNLNPNKHHRTKPNSYKNITLNF